MNSSVRHPRHRSLKLGLILVLLLVIFYGFYTYWVLSSVRGLAEGWIEARQGDGWIVQHGDLQPNLFLEHASIRIQAPKVTFGDVEWTAPYLTVSRYFFDPGHVKLVVTGDQFVTVKGRAWRFSAFPLRIDARLSSGAVRIKDIHATATDVQVVGPEKSAFLSQALALAAQADGTADTPALNLIVTAIGADFKQPDSDGLISIASAEMHGRVIGGLRFAPPQQALTDWSHKGGVVQLDHILVDWAPVKLEGNGTLALDEHLQPQAALSAKLQGLSKLPDVLTMNKAQAEALRNAAKDQSPLPVTLQNGQLWIAGMAVAKQPLVPWPWQ